MVHLELLDDQYAQVWDKLVAQLEGGTVFHTWAWMRAVEKVKQAEKLPVGIFDGTELVGVLPFFRVHRGPLTVLASPLGELGYGGPLVKKSCHHSIFGQMDKLLEQWKADYVEIRSLQPSTSRGLADRGYTVQELQTYVLCLNLPLQQIWGSLKGRCRTAIRKARKNGVQIEEVTDKSFLDIYYEFVKDTYSKSRRPPSYARQDYGIVWDILKPHDAIKVWLAKYEGRTIAGAIVLCSHGRLYGWDRAGLRAYYPLNPNNLLDWAIIEWGARNGMIEYDMMGANVPNIASFKKSFGSQLRTYSYASKDVNWRAYLGRRFYLWLKPLVRRVRFKLRTLNTATPSAKRLAEEVKR
jgi:hypothetical protein